MTPQEKFETARCRLTLREPFFATILMHLRKIEDKTVPTMCTNGVVLKWNPAFVETLSVDEVKGVLAHEAMHVIFLHMFRRGSRDPFKFNIAADYAINNELDTYKSPKGEKNFALPKGGCINHKWDGKCAEEIYALLPEMKKTQVSGMGDFEDAPAKDDEGRGLVEQEEIMKVAIVQAAQAAKIQGKLSSNLERLVQETCNPPAPWRQILRRFISVRAKDDYSWKRPNRRHISRGIYLPSLDSLRCGRIAIAIDTSGSIGEEILGLFLTEIQAIMDEVRPESVNVLQCDAAIHSNDTYMPGDLIASNFQMKGGGGTSFVPIFEELENDPPICLVYLTDLFGSFPEIEPGFPTLWASISDQNVPFGEIVRIGIE